MEGVEVSVFEVAGLEDHLHRLHRYLFSSRAACKVEGALILHELQSEIFEKKFH